MSDPDRARLDVTYRLYSGQCKFEIYRDAIFVWQRIVTRLDPAGSTHQCRLRLFMRVVNGISIIANSTGVAAYQSNQKESSSAG